MILFYPQSYITWKAQAQGMKKDTEPVCQRLLVESAPDWQVVIPACWRLQFF
jgi:hypothetical protein